MIMSKVSAGAGKLLLASLLVLVGAVPLWAQSNAASVRGRVVDEAGAPLGGAEIRATEVETGLERATLSRPDGAYILLGLKAGTYELRVSGLGYAAQQRTVQVLVGQSLELDFQLTAQALELEGLTVTANRAVETRTPEVATNVTREQIESLPQQDRNFLNFTALAPGVTVSRQETNKQFTAGGLPATKVNVFIDGASYKNDILEGGVHGQDASRGNPFPQIAVREFRVVTQNFKAEHQRAGSAVVTAETKSGTNEFRVDGFVLGQNRNLVERDPGAVLDCEDAQSEGQPCAPKPEYERLQAGLSVGGPIIEDRLHYFLGYEGNYQNRQERVALGREGFDAQFGEYEGTFDQPFRSTLLFGKMSYSPSESQTVDVSYHGRIESDKRGFGGTTSYESAENVAIGTHVATVQHTLAGGDWLNQAHVSLQRATWNPTVVNEDQEIGQEYMGVIRIGARSTEQEFVQDRLALRNDLSYTGLEWAGWHVIKGGVNVDFLNYEVAKRFDGNPTFYYDVDESLTVPVRARWGSGDPGMSEGNIQFGWFLQDDWDVTDRLQLNLGLRWDAETNQFNNDWVTPDSIRATLGDYLPSWADPDDYFTEGEDDRPMYLGAFQPRVGFSYDFFGTGETVLHGGFGVYYDREVWNHLIDERFRLQWVVRDVNFTTTGEPGEVAWDPSYLSRAGLQSLADQVNPGVTAEVFLLQNDAKPPKTHQWSVGLRQAVSGVVLGATYRGVRAYNMLSWYCGIPHSEHGYCNGGSELGLPYSPILATDEGRRWYDAVDLTVEKPYSAESRWGASLAYTYADAERKGMDFFTLEFPDVNPADWPRVEQTIEKHRVVASGILLLPWEVKASTLIQLGSGIPYNQRDETVGWGPRRVETDWASEDPPNFRQVDLRLEKEFTVQQGRLGLLVEAINVFNHDNFREYEGLYAFPGGTVNENFGNPLRWTADPGRRVQLGVTLGY